MQVACEELGSRGGTSSLRRRCARRKDFTPRRSTRRASCASMHLIQLLIPVYDNRGASFPASHYATLREELAERFGGLTAYSRAPAQGLWEGKDGEAPAKRDDIIVYEVMADALDRAWWERYRRTLEERFRQDELVIRAQVIERL